MLFRLFRIEWLVSTQQHVPLIAPGPKGVADDREEEP